jgi:hypothetical protein
MKYTMLKKLLFFIILSFYFFPSIAQDNFCATVTTDEIRQKMLEISREARLGIKSRNTQLYIPVLFHIVGRDNGTGYFATESLFRLLCEVNQQFEPLNVRFYMHSLPNYINNSAYFIHDFWTGYQMMVENNVLGVVNTYMVSDPAGACGYAYYPYSGPPGGGIALKHSCSGAGSTTFAHELGHFFSLPHTFDGWDNNPEFVNGSNCNIAGDFFCDTRADFINYRWSCPYTNQIPDPNGDIYEPDGTNFMSYSNEPCPTNFSSEQQSAMIYSMINDYGGLLTTHPTPPLHEVAGIPTPVSPDANTMLTNKNHTFTWTKVEGAEYYHLIIHLKNFTNSSKIEFFTKDTFQLVTNLRSKYQYEWKIKAFHKNSTCAPFARSFFNTAENLGIEILSSQEKLNLFPNPVKSGAIVQIAGIEGMDLKEIEILDLQGRSLSKKYTSEPVDAINMALPNIPAGIYLIKLSGSQHFLYRRLVVE